MTMTYSSYLHLDTLLNLQTGSQPQINNDELLFITIHQVCELWFKLLINTFEEARNYLNEDRLYEAISAFQRARMIIKTLVGQTDIISTLTPVAFNQYRSLLGGSSGLQSYQFREMEFLLGYKREQVLSIYPSESLEYQKLQRRLQDESVPEALAQFIYRNHPVAKENHQENFFKDYAKHLVSIYKTKRDIVVLLDLLLDIDEGLQEWRYRHIKLVERVIGSKQGTGGTPGIEFLKATLFKPFFPVLWEIRSEL